MSEATELDAAMRSTFEGNFLDAADVIATGDITLTISGVVAPGKERDATKKVIDKPIVAFKGAKKRLILNKHNAKVIAMHYGAKASAWAGKSITLTVRVLAKAFGQDNVPVVRVQPPEGRPLTFGMRKWHGAPLAPSTRGRERPGVDTDDEPESTPSAALFDALDDVRAAETVADVDRAVAMMPDSREVGAAAAKRMAELG